MRLTLRTMLAYLDDILDASDASELGRKIEESKFAGELVHRIRGSIGRLRLGAPKPDGKGMGLDPNTVAEYLDNTLKPEQVPDFEKVCLESDVHLAEVASCHQILTLVLGEPAEVEHAIRERIYGVGVAPPAQRNGSDGADEPAPHLAALLAKEAGVAGSTVGDETAGSNRVIQPPSSRRPRFPLKSLAVTVVLAFLLALVGLRAMGEFNAGHPLWRLIDSQATASKDTDPAQQVAPPIGSLLPAADETRPAESIAATDSSDPPAGSEPTNAGEAAVETPRQAIEEPGRVVIGGEEDAEQVVMGAPAVAVAEQATVAPDRGRVVPAVGEAAIDFDAENTELSPDLPSPGAAEAPRTQEVVDSTTELVPAEPTTLGRFISEEQCLARLEAGDWRRLTPDAPLAAGDKLVVLPTYRPQILLQAGPKVTLVGATHVTIGEHVNPAGSTVPLLSVAFGRALLVPVAEGPSTVVCEFGDRQVSLELGDIHSSVAVDVRRYRAPGTDPEVSPANLTVRLHVLGGQVRWHESGGPPLELQSGQLVAALGGEPAGVYPIGGIPAWVGSNGLRPIERRASQDLLEFLSYEFPLVRSLMEQAEVDRQRRVELRALANRSLVMLGVFDTVLGTFQDERHRAYWGDYYQSLSFALSLGPETATRLRLVIEGAQPDIGATIYRLLRGFSSAQLATGDAQQLVKQLDHPLMSVRVLSYLNLEEITGLTHMYMPFQKVSQSRGTIAQWHRSLEEGRVAYRSEPVPFPELVSAE